MDVKTEEKQSLRRTELFGASIQMMMLSAVAIWLFCDPALSDFLGNVRSGRVPQIPATTPVFLGIAIIIGFVAGVWPVARRRRFTLRFGLWNLLIAAVVCSLFVNREGLRWLGYRWRATSHVQQLDTLAERLSRDWPTEDGEIEGLGPFTSYPFNKPSVLLLLTPYPVDSTETVVTSVERVDRSLLFQLGGTDAGVWLQWSPDGSPPTAYESGLAERRLPSKFAALSRQWHVVAFEDSKR